MFRPSSEITTPRSTRSNTCRTSPYFPNRWWLNSQRTDWVRKTWNDSFFIFHFSFSTLCIFFFSCLSLSLYSFSFVSLRGSVVRSDYVNHQKISSSFMHTANPMTFCAEIREKNSRQKYFLFNAFVSTFLWQKLKCSKCSKWKKHFFFKWLKIIIRVPFKWSVFWIKCSVFWIKCSVF